MISNNNELSEFNFNDETRRSAILPDSMADQVIPHPSENKSGPELVAELCNSLVTQKHLRSQLFSTIESMVDLGMIKQLPESYRPVFDLMASNLSPLNDKEGLQLIRIGNKLQADHEFLEYVTKQSFAQHVYSPAFEVLEKLLRPTLGNLGLAKKVQKDISNSISSLLPVLHGDEIIEILRGCVVAKVVDEALLCPLIERLQLLKSDGELLPSDLRQIVGILTESRAFPPNKLKPLAQLILSLVDTQQGDDLLEASLYLSRASQLEDGFVNKLSTHLLANPDSLSGEGCGLLLDLFRVTGTKDYHSVMKTLERLITVSSHTEINSLVDASRAISAMRIRSPRLFAIIGAQSETRLSTLTSDRLRNMVADCGQLNIIPPVLLSFIDHEISKREISGRNMCDIIFSFSRLNVSCPAILTKFEKQLNENQGDIRYAPSEVASLMWSLAVHNPELAGRVWNVMQENYRKKFSPHESFDPNSKEKRSWIKFDNLNSPSLHGLYHALVAMKMQIPQSVLARVKNATGYQEYAQHKTNFFEQSVESVLTKLGIEHRSQYYFEGYILDFLIQQGDRVIALECDGTKYHIAGRQSQGVMNGSSIIKTKFLQNRGFEVIRILSDSWQNAKDHVGYLEKLLKSK